MPDFARARCRFIPDFWKLAALSGAAMALFAFMASVQPRRAGEEWIVLMILFGMAGATPFYWFVARARGAVIFDANGARWRTAFGAWKSARWDEIEGADVRMISAVEKYSHWRFVVQTRAGEFSWTNQFENSETLAPFAARYCAFIEAEVEDWPRRFGYRSGENRFVFFCVLFLSGGFALLLFQSLSSARWRDGAAQIEIYAELYGWLLTVSGLALFGLIIIAIPALFLALCLRLALADWRHRDEVFVATKAGLSWRDNGRERLFSAWDELQSLHVEARGPFLALPFHRLQSARGEFRWDGGLSGAAQLRRVIFERAPQLVITTQAELREELEETPDEQGEVLTFNFKTRTLRATLWGGAVFSIVCWGLAVFGSPQPPNGDPPPFWLVAIIALLVTAATFYGIQLFRRGCIVLDARGIRWNLPLHKKFTVWEEIGALNIRQRRLMLQIGARRVPLAPFDMYPARLELLTETIARRAINAGGQWK